MPIQPMTFENLKVPERVSPLSRTIQSALNTFQDGAKTAYLLPNLQAELKKAQLDNLINQPKADYAKDITLADLMNKRANTDLTSEQAKYYAPNVTSEINLRNAQTRQIPTSIDLMKQQIIEAVTKNKYLPEMQKADIAEKNAMGEYYKTGGSKTSAWLTEKRDFLNGIARDNPQLKTPEQIREAENVLRDGGNQLSDGTPLNPMSADTRDSFNKMFKGTSTSALITRGVLGNQAEAELPVVDKYISAGRKPYGNTTLGVSPAFVKDSLNVDDEAAQTRVGKYYASDLLNFDKAALQTRIAGTESGVTIIEDVMNRARQTINSNSMLKTDKARQVALDTVSNALREMLAARNKYGVGASGASGKNNSESSGKVTKRWVRNSNGQLVEQ